MEAILDKEFYEITEEESLSTEGGLPILPFLIVAGVVAVGGCVAYDLYSTYKEGYNEVISSTPPASATVSGGDVSCGDVSCGDAVY